MTTYDKQINYFESIRSHYASYHNHKELAAWASIVLLAIVTGIISRSDLALVNKIGPSVLTLAVLIVAALVHRYVKAQLAMKDIGGSYVAAAMWYVNKLLNDELGSEEVKSLLAMNYNYEPDALSKMVLPNEFVKKAQDLNKQARGFQDTTRSVLYGLIILFSGLSVMSIWLRFFL